MAFYQDGNEFVLSELQLAIKHLLITALLTPACLYRSECPSVNIYHNHCAPSPLIDVQVKTAIWASQTIGKALYYFSGEN